MRTGSCLLGGAQAGAAADGSEPHGLALWEARLEVELCHRALALLRLQLSSAQEDVEDLQVSKGFTLCRGHYCSCSCCAAM